MKYLLILFALTLATVSRGAFFPNQFTTNDNPTARGVVTQIVTSLTSTGGVSATQVTNIASALDAQKSNFVTFATGSQNTTNTIYEGIGALAYFGVDTDLGFASVHTNAQKTEFAMYSDKGANTTSNSQWYLELNSDLGLDNLFQVRSGNSRSGSHTISLTPSSVREAFVINGNTIMDINNGDLTATGTVRAMNGAFTNIVSSGGTNLHTLAAANFNAATFLTNWANSISNLAQTKQQGSATLTNISGTGAATNENSTALQIDTGILSLSPGVLSNLNASTIAVIGNLISNLTATKFSIQQPAITTSNLLISFNTNVYECVGLTNVQLTNLVEELTGVNARAKVVVRNTLGVSVPVMLPAFGAQHGYYFHTNGLNDILSASVAPPGTNTVYSLEVDGTNIYASVTYWRHP